MILDRLIPIRRIVDATQYLKRRIGTTFSHRTDVMHDVRARIFFKLVRRSAPFIDFATMPNGMHNDGVLGFEDFKDDAVRTLSDLL